MNKMESFDLGSDLHLDFWINVKNQPHKQEKAMKEFVKKVLPDSPSSTLVIAGDLGNYNSQNIMFLNIIKEFYTQIIIVFGNHDYYVPKGKVRIPSYSFKRIQAMKEFIRSLDSVYDLEEGNVTIDGITFGGCTMWYDFSYAINVLQSNENEMYQEWRRKSNDSKFISGIKNKIFLNQQKEILRNSLLTADVIVTHVAPDWSLIPDEMKDELHAGFSYFDNSEFVEAAKGKVWCYGHVHSNEDYVREECRYVNNALGYNDERNNIVQPFLKVVV